MEMQSIIERAAMKRPAMEAAIAAMEEAATKVRGIMMKPKKRPRRPEFMTNDDHLFIGLSERGFSENVFRQGIRKCIRMNDPQRALRIIASWFAVQGGHGYHSHIMARLAEAQFAVSDMRERHNAARPLIDALGCAQGNGRCQQQLTYAVADFFGDWD